MRPLHALAFALALTSLGGTARADDTLKLAIGQRGLWDTAISDLGQRAGIFKKHGLNLDITYTQGSGETQQAAISESVDIGISIGIMGAISAYAKGAPVRLIGTEIIGAGDLYWYVRADSPIKSLADTNGKTIAYSTNGSSTNGVAVAFVKQYNLSAKLVATGGPAPTLTAVMSNQIDVGWGAPPFGLDQIDQGTIRVIATGDDAHVFRGQTVRVLLTTANKLQAKKPLIERFMKGYRETIDWMYDNPAALKVYADFNNITEARAKNIRDRFFKKQVLNPDKIVGLDVILPDAVAFKYIQAPLTKEQLAEFIQIPPR